MSNNISNSIKRYFKNGDTVAFEVTDENDNVLANDNTETQSYANVSIKYMSENGSEIPNTETATIPVAVGTTINWKTNLILFMDISWSK